MTYVKRRSDYVAKLMTMIALRFENDGEMEMFIKVKFLGLYKYDVEDG